MLIATYVIFINHDIWQYILDRGMLYECFSYSCVFDSFLYSDDYDDDYIDDHYNNSAGNQCDNFVYMWNFIVFITYHIFVEIYLCIVWYHILVWKELWMS